MKRKINPQILVLTLSIISILLGVSLIAQIVLVNSIQKSSTDNTVEFPSVIKQTSLTTDNITVSQTAEIEETEIVMESITPTITLTVTATPTKKVTIAPTTKAPAVTTIAPTQTATPSTIPDTSLPRQVSPGCPATTQGCVPCTSGTYCRFELGYTSYGFLGWSCQNNNPGNIRPSGYRNGIIVNNGGTAPCGSRTDANGRGDYMIFASYNDGFNALKAYLTGISLGQHSSYVGTVNDVYQVCGECNLKLFSAKYVGTTIEAQNESNSYANRIATRLGVNADTTTLNWLVANKLSDLATAIKVNEGWYGD